MLDGQIILLQKCLYFLVKNEFFFFIFYCSNGSINISEIKIQPELNSKLIPPHYRGEVANSSAGGGSSAVDSSEGAAAAAINDN